MTDQKDIKKSVEETVNQILTAEVQAANGGATQTLADPTTDAKKSESGEFPVRDGEIRSGSPEAVSANGGKDRIKNDSPLATEEPMMGDKKKKVEEAKKALADAEAELDKAMAAKKGKEEDQEEDKEDEEEDEEDEEKEKAKKAYPRPPRMKKSIQELSEHLDSDELDLIKTWREEVAKDEAIAKSQSAEPLPTAQPSMAKIEEVLKKAVAEGTADLRKAIDEKETLIKGLNDKIEKMASQPAYDRRSISNLETLEKSGSATAELSKGQVLDKMLELQAAGKGVTSHHIAEFEATRNISDPTVRGIVFRELKLN